MRRLLNPNGLGLLLLALFGLWLLVSGLLQSSPAATGPPTADIALPQASSPASTGESSPPSGSPTPPATEAAPAATASPAPTTSPTQTAATPSPTPTSDTLTTLLDAVVPPRDLREIAIQLQGLENIPVQASTAPANHAVGDVVTFWAGNVDTNEKFQLDARLAYATEHVYFFVDTRISTSVDDVARVTDTFEAQIYPTTRAFFGSEWSPGVDGDPHLYILYAQGLGFRVAGYYSSADEYVQQAHQFSNEKEMFYINADTTSLGAGYLPAVLAHEFQHMIHWANDGNETTWLNEGASELARYLNGFDGAGFAPAFVANPDLQLNTWSEPGASSAAHYGAGFMFLAYFLDRFGEVATQALVANPANGLPSMSATLAALGLTDPLSGQPLTAEQVFADWVIANYLHTAEVGDGRYTYHDFSAAPQLSAPTRTYTTCPTGAQSHTVHQFGADYHAITCTGEVTIQFRGTEIVPVVPTAAHSGQFAFWGHRQDNSVARLSRSFDLTNTNTATLAYWTWYAIEEDYDFAYVEVSTDGGETWTILETPSGTDTNPTGNNLGWGYNGFSGGSEPGEWISEQVNLSPYAGQAIQLRFEYVTDDATNREGILLDDVAIPEIGYFEDFEGGAQGWLAEGFVRIDNVLPQTFLVQLIRQRPGGTTVEALPLDSHQTGEVTLAIEPGETVTVVVSGTTLFTTELAVYELEIQ